MSVRFHLGNKVALAVCVIFCRLVFCYFWKEKVGMIVWCLKGALILSTDLV
jgi:hypothetical protein